LYFNINTKFDFFNNYILLEISLKLIILIAKNLLRYLANFIFSFFTFFLLITSKYIEIYIIYLIFFYIISNYFFYFKYRKFVNIFILILKFYRTNIKNIIKVFSRSICRLNCKIIIKINKKKKFVYIYYIFFLKNIF